MHYHDPSDLRHASTIAKAAGAGFGHFAKWQRETLHGADNVIPPKYAELMAVSVALTTQCVYCIEAHTRAAAEAGATEEELAEVVMIAAALRSGAAFSHGFVAMKFFEAAQGRGDDAEVADGSG